MIIKLLLIACIIVFIIDLSGVIDEMEKRLAKWLKVKCVRIPKPFSCSLCSTWWLTLLFCLCTGHFTIPWIAYCGFLAFLTPVILNTLLFLREVLNKVIDVLSQLLKLK